MLGEEVIVSDELDLWGAYLFGARLQPLEEHGFHHLGNCTTDFDAYYDGLMDRGPKREPPRMFLEEPARSFVERMATERPPEWRKAAGVILDLSIPELAFVCVKSKEAGQMATARKQFVELDFGRGVLIGVPAHADQDMVLAYAAEASSDASFFVYAKESGSKNGSIAWANYGATISFELSEFERRANASCLPRSATKPPIRSGRDCGAIETSLFTRNRESRVRLTLADDVRPLRRHCIGCRQIASRLRVSSKGAVCVSWIRAST